MEKFEVDGILYNTTSEYTVEVTSRENEYTGDISIPSTIVYNTKNYDVTSIGKLAFWGCSGLTNIDIPDSVTSIGSRAFEECSGLKSIVIPDSVTSIGEGAFSFCSGLTSIVIPNSVTSIGEGAFSGCSGLKSIKVESTNTYFDSRNDCNAIINSKTNELIAGCVNTIIPNSVTRIGVSAFSGCSELKSFEIPDSVTSIGELAFWGCSGLTSIVIPNSVTSIGDGAFVGCSGLTSIVIPDSVTSIRERAFLGCSRLKSIVIPDNVTSIGSNAFYGCSGLTSVVIPDSVTSIGDCAFYDCSGLKSIVIPDSVTSIGEGAFLGCSKLTSIKVESGNKYYDSRNDCNAIINSSTNELIAGCVNTVIPNSVTSIEKAAFAGCSELTSIVIPESVTSIGERAFSGCKRLKDVYNYSDIPQKIDGFWGEAFNSNPTIHVPKGCTDAYKKSYYWRRNTIIDDICLCDIESFHLDQAKYHCDIKCAITPELIVVPKQDAKELKQEWSVSDSSIAFIDGKTGLFVGLGTGKVNICVKMTGDDGKEFTATAEVVVGDVCEAPEITFHNGKITCRSKTAKATCHYTYKYIGLEDGRGENYGEVTPQIEITAYASAEGYNDSETVCKTFDLFPVTIVKKTIVTNEQQGTDELPF